MEDGTVLFITEEGGGKFTVSALAGGDRTTLRRLKRPRLLVIADLNNNNSNESGCVCVSSVRDTNMLNAAHTRCVRRSAKECNAPRHAKCLSSRLDLGNARISL